MPSGDDLTLFCIFYHGSFDSFTVSLAVCQVIFSFILLTGNKACRATNMWFRGKSIIVKFGKGGIFTSGKGREFIAGEGGPFSSTAVETIGDDSF